MSIPRHRIPKIKAECLACGSMNVSTVMSTPHAAGYHRRHLCNECDAPFYTLARYDGSGYDRKDKPFKDRPLTPWEQQQRIEWAAEAREVTIEVNPSPYATEFIETLNIVFDKKQRGLDLTEDEVALIEAVTNLEKAYYD